jgi:hypothetical protein
MRNVGGCNTGDAKSQRIPPSGEACHPYRTGMARRFSEPALHSAYRRCFEVAHKRHQVHRLPAISASVRIPNGQCLRNRHDEAKVALENIELEKVVFVPFSEGAEVCKTMRKVSGNLKSAWIRQLKDTSNYRYWD